MASSRPGIVGLSDSSVMPASAMIGRSITTIIPPDRLTRRFEFLIVSGAERVEPMKL